MPIGVNMFDTMMLATKKLTPHQQVLGRRWVGRRFGSRRRGLQLIRGDTA